ncbi:MAG: 3-dehydroquinate synthase [Gammaproteobacteria bacterium RIFCSPLOWO2_02_FULL_47_50]|nr:MAG: 3-dehydroquinate synthase [Gammaproteobacteria bacterium RIFCSPLOWO2_01_FULL_47_190]OGT76280.1 MAG: 3-dehydroquinate synthase [Gammaproteobacteria bacterium RIFCSPLOWO2_12_47_11]OGT79705.1 MAG: 3-dehydroquinate synthase [Gammaproteobacteria bacterium RIFCSPLOWO2_02_FULL_47_50]OGT87767.1 MAG: 3-dehydroquinate synthase [Gammaproteobacteria bacterium RIFCSPLOWO2_12_FULL_47_76]
MKEIRVELGEHAYPIFIGGGLLDKPEIFKNCIRSKQVLVVTNDTIASLYLERTMRSLGSFTTDKVILPDGEQYKTLDVMNEIITRLLQQRYSRNCCLVALGGGVIGDITGFAAACYQRGVDYIQVPTTVLAQVDSSVGGKTAVNHKLGKNMIGAFHQPRAVITDISTLLTLHDRELQAGLAEVIKYGLIRDRKFFEWLEQNIEKLLHREIQEISYAIEVSCRNKAEVVAIDEKESGMRAILNLGHTFGHAIETGLDYKGWLHGEAVAAGMLMAADLSSRHGWLSTQDLERTRKILTRAKLPVRLPPTLTPARMLELMAVDKKARDGAMHLVLMKQLGEAFVTNQFDPEKLRATLENFSSATESR